MMRPFHLTNTQYLKALIFVWVAIVLFNPGAIEGRLFPAAAPMTLTRVEPDDDGNALVWGSSERLRADCSFRHVSWYLGHRGDLSVPARVITGKPILRPKGAFTFGPWIVDVPAVEIQNSHADVYHQCRYFGIDSPWMTKSRFWK